MYMGSHSHAPAVLLQVYEYRYNVEFSDTFASVSYTNHNFQTFSQADSCANCTLQDVFVGINRYHRFFFLFTPVLGIRWSNCLVGMDRCNAVLQHPFGGAGGGGEYTFFQMKEAAIRGIEQAQTCRAYLAVVKSNGGKESNLLLPSAVLTLNAIYGEILAAVQQVSITVIVPCTCTSIHKQEAALKRRVLHLSTGTFAHPCTD